jgi:hypothetical protein
MPQHSSSDPSYRREAVAVGPFTDEPLDLLPVLCELPDGSWRTGDEIRAGSREWLTAALYSTGVALGDHDRFVIGLLAEDGWPTVQVVAGWIARAHRSEDHGNGERATDRSPPRSSESAVQHDGI